MRIIMKDKVIYNIGAGGISVKDHTNLFNDGWKEYTVDVAECNPDIVSNIVGLPGIEDESADAIWASHVVEHVYWHELPEVFKAFMRVLKPSGVAYIMVPDLSTIADYIKNDILGVIYQSEGGPITALDMIYGHRGQVKENSFMQHKTGFTAGSLSSILCELEINALVRPTGLELEAVLYRDVYPHFIHDPNFLLRK